MAFTPRVLYKGNTAVMVTSADEEAQLLWDGWSPEAGSSPPVPVSAFDDRVRDLIVADGSATELALRAAFESWGGGAGGGSGVNPSDVGYDLVLLMGQSNAAGSDSSDPRLDPADSRVFQYDTAGTYAGKIVGASEPLISPGLPFGRWYASSVPVNRRVLLVNAAVGATGLTATSGTTWNPAVRGSLFDNAVNYALAARTAAGPNSRFVAVLWVQGETDSLQLNGGQITAEQYATTLDALIGQVRAGLNAPDLPFLVGSMVPEWVAAQPGASVIQGVHAATPSRVARTAYVQSPPGGGRSDETIHYSAAGQRTLGRLLAAALPTARANTTPGGGTPPTDPGTGTTPVAPSQVTGLTTSAPAESSISLAWTAPNPGTQPITDYIVQYRQAGASSWLTFVDGVGTVAAVTVTGLAPATDYEFRVAAISSVGTGPYSATATASTTAASDPAADFGPAPTVQRGNPTYTATGKFGNALSDGVLQVAGLGWAGQTQTVELWMKTSLAGGPIVSFGDGALWLAISGGMANTEQGGGGPQIQDDQWHHVAAVRVPGGTGRLYVDGARVFDIPGGATFADTASIGGFGAVTGFDWLGQLDEVRLSKGARYTGDSFTVPTSPLTADASTVGLYHLNG